ncbi:endonuclease NucS domain-containing protein [Salimicrobium jeotgali]|uniref:endonuclease NucS domain-containing protein n=1 Tax=Salimicrobium jeotgali TaxID=1230341 RepID=UPI000C853606|nr:endonuclease NucS domain-containing protein [Salimicrobium jeotgali]
MSRSYLVPYNRKNSNDPLFSELTYGHSTDLTTVEKNEYIFFHTKILDKRYITAFYKVFDKKTVEEINQDSFLNGKVKNPHINEGEKSDILVFGNPVYSHVLERPVPLDDELLHKFFNGKRINQGKLIMNKAKDPLDLIEYLMEFQQIPLQNIKLTTNDIYHLRESDIENFIESYPDCLENNLQLVGRQKRFSDKSRLDLLFKDKAGIYVVVEIKKGLIDEDTYQQLKGYVDALKKEKNLREVRGMIVCRGFASDKSKDFYVDKINKGKVELSFHAWKFDLKKVTALDLLNP